MSTVHIIDHPLIQHKLTFIRDRNTNSKEFRELVDEVATLMAYEVTRDLKLEDTEVVTPIGPCKTKVISGQDVGVVAILRAGLGMIDGILRLIPNAKVGHRDIPGSGHSPAGRVLLQAAGRSGST